MKAGMRTRSDRLSSPMLAAGRRAPLVASLAPLGLILALGGCGSSENEKLEARLAALEAKADAADKRSRQALSMAATNNPAPVVESGTTDSFGEPSSSDEVTDGSADSAIYENTIEAPAGPPIAPGF